MSATVEHLEVPAPGSPGLPMTLVDDACLVDYMVATRRYLERLHTEFQRRHGQPAPTEVGPKSGE